MPPIQKYVLAQYKKCAAKRGYDFLLSDDTFLELCKDACVYCGKKDQNVAKRNQYAIKEWSYNGIDRVNSDLPYSIGNVVSCCGNCNKAKSDRTVSEFMEWLQKGK